MKIVVIKLLFCVCRCFSFKLLPFVLFSQRVRYYFIDKMFFRRTEPVAWRCSAKKMSEVSCKIHQKTALWESSLSLKLQDTDL